MTRVLTFAAGYFAIVFAAGFVLGTIRTLFVAPYLGQLGSVAAELPVMLAVSWWAAGALCRRVPLGTHQNRYVAAGLLALVLLLLGEAAISVWLGGLTLSQHLALYQTPPVLLGFLAQLAFALFPALRMRR